MGDLSFIKNGPCHPLLEAVKKDNMYAAGLLIFNGADTNVVDHETGLSSFEISGGVHADSLNSFVAKRTASVNSGTFCRLFDFLSDMPSDDAFVLETVSATVCDMTKDFLKLDFLHLIFDVKL
jgi:hypothetical protein